MRLQIHVGALHGLGDCKGSPQVAKGSGVLLRWAPPPRSQLLIAPQPQRRAQKRPRFPVPRTHTPPGNCGVGVPTFTRPAKGLSEETAQRSPVPHDPCRMGPRQLQPDNFCRPQERLWGVQAEAARGSGLVSGFGEGSRVGVPQGSCSLRSTLPIPALT